jgi:hypothetical protein
VQIGEKAIGEKAIRDQRPEISKKDCAVEHGESFVS